MVCLFESSKAANLEKWIAYVSSLLPPSIISNVYSTIVQSKSNFSMFDQKIRPF